MVGADSMIASEWSKTLRILFKQMWANNERCDNWDLILSLHDQEDRDYLLMLEKEIKSHGKFKN